MTAPHYSDLWQGIAHADPDRIAIITRDDRVTWGRLAAEAGALARHLSERGLSVGDAAGMLLYNRPEYLSFTWACLAIGVAPVAINYRYRAGEVRDLILDSDLRVLLVPASLAELAREAVAGIEPAVELIVVDDSAAHGGDAIDGATRYEDVVAAGGVLPPQAPRGAELRLYTGGTTGMPKAVVWDLDTLLVARQQSTWGLIGVTPPTDLDGAIRIAVDPATPRVVTLPLTPLLHGTAQSTTMGTLALGGTVVLHAAPRMDIEEALRLTIYYDVTRLIVAGDALALPFVEAAERLEVALSGVNSIVSSGMRFSDDVKRRLHALGDIAIVDMLASSEGGPYAFGITHSAQDLPAKLMITPGTVLLDEDLNEIQADAGALGILAFRGILPKGYYRDPEKTEKTFPTIRGNRYVMPGDWARARGDGSVDLLGRLAAVVNTGGEKVFPAEVEDVLLEHEGVDDVIVFGMPDRRFGEVVSAMVAPMPGSRIDVPELLAFLDQRLAGYKKPRHVFVRDSLERSSTGKVELARVKADAARELARLAETADVAK
ncbi:MULTISPECIES: AMP-binding protein [unclassified Microbacterium]|uniref:AMP-binding protein n=1 Tax=unclassified Microbacterium TaxID=2609290 RepID=UPI00214AB94F|nr:MULTISPECIES: AMP-binding protein [unclassified Microbacterium]MCR2808629.1 AMP-binding protein [Microbacterium sp. zg.B185]WIM18937.1 AMP-binding protein [Microbacterium sp. zg-B185]